MVAPKGAVFCVTCRVQCRTQFDLQDFPLRCQQQCQSGSCPDECTGGLGELDFHYQGSGGNIKSKLSVGDVKEVIIWLLLNVPVTSKERI